MVASYPYSKLASYSSRLHARDKLQSKPFYYLSFSLPIRRSFLVYLVFIVKLTLLGIPLISARSGHAFCYYKNLD
jgi:hypothetical protein